jgi:septal ring factor EnvC (AmiA/AmiB activator)
MSVMRLMILCFLFWNYVISRSSRAACQIEDIVLLQAASVRAREAELDGVRSAYTAAEGRVDNITQRLKVSGLELKRVEEALRASQRQVRLLKQRLDDAETLAESQRTALTSLEEHKGDVVVRGRACYQPCLAASFL